MPVVNKQKRSKKSKVVWGYRVLGKLSEDERGVIYAAEEIETCHRVAFRGFKKPKTVDIERWNLAMQKFAEALETQKDLGAHPAIQGIERFGEEDGSFYVLSEYFEGRTLREILDVDGKKEFDWTLHLLGDIASAVDYAATKNHPHTDLTPYNIVITNGNWATKITNFGLGRVRTKIGSPYLSPEQVAGSDGTSRSDVFAVGCLLYEVLTGAPPFKGDTREA